MQFEPIEFQRFAQFFGLADGPFSGARYRSAVSRSYYAVFLTAREKLRAAFRELQYRPRLSHWQVTEAFRASGNRELIRIGHLLAQLRTLREESDYELQRPIGQVNAREANKLAEELLKALTEADIGRCNIDGVLRRRPL